MAMTRGGSPLLELAASQQGGATEVFDGLFGIGQQADALVQQELQGLGPLSFAVVLGAGLATSLSPCTLSVLPLTIGYIGGYQQPIQQQPQPSQQTAADGSGEGDSATDEGSSNASASGESAGPTSVVGAATRQRQQQQQQAPLLVRATAFSAGLATTFASLGMASSLLGRAYGQIGSGLPLAVGVVAILMGLNLLEVLPLQLPSLDLDARKINVPPALQAYLVGITFALAASPCSTPVLVSLLGYVSTSGNPLAGAALLMAYSAGYVAPLLLAAASTDTLARLMSLRTSAAWLSPASGCLLVAGGTYTLLSRLVV